LLPNPSSIQTLLTQFQTRYPLGSLISELLTIHQDHYVVRASVQIGGMLLATGMASAAEIELAEDRAKVRALEAMGALLSAPPQTQFSSVHNLAGQLLTDYGTVTNSIAHSVPSSPSGPISAVSSPPEATGDAPIPTSSLPLPLSSLTERSAEMPSEILELEQPIQSIATDFDLPLVSDREIEQPKVDVSLLDLEADLPAFEATAAADSFPFDLTSQEDFAPPQSTPAQSKPEKMKRKAESSAVPADASPAKEEDRSEEIARIGVEMKRLGWSTAQGRDYLKQAYGKRSRQELNDTELLDFLHHLESQPSPLASPF
jgi:hypothetical protein